MKQQNSRRMRLRTTWLILVGAMLGAIALGVAFPRLLAASQLLTMSLAGLAILGGLWDLTYPIYWVFKRRKTIWGAAGQESGGRIP